MSAAWTLMAVAAPWFAGTAIVRWIRIRDRSWLLELASGWLLGQFLVFIGLFASLRMGGPSHARWLLGLIVLLGAVATAARRRAATPIFHQASPAPNRASTYILAVLAIGIAIKFTMLLGATAWVPSRCNDAVAIWLFKAKTIATLNRLPVDPASDFYLGGSNPRYPIFLPLLSAWTPLVASRWHEPLAVLPWPLFYLSLVMLAYGGLRLWLGRVPAALAAYAVGSLPLLVVHAYRPGYADLPLAVFLAAAVLHGFAWRRGHDVGSFVLGTLFVVGAACMKREGLVLATVVEAVLVGSNWRRLAPHGGRLLIVALLGAAVAVAALVDMSDLVDALRRWDYHPEAWRPLARHAFEWSSFGPLFWFAAIATAGLLVAQRTGDRAAPWLVLALCGCVSAIFLLTPNVAFALNDQTPSRCLLQIAPAVIISLSIGLSGVGIGRLGLGLQRS